MLIWKLIPKELLKFYTQRCRDIHQQEEKGFCTIGKGIETGVGEILDFKPSQVCTLKSSGEG